MTNEELEDKHIGWYCSKSGLRCEYALITGCCSVTTCSKQMTSNYTKPSHTAKDIQDAYNQGYLAGHSETEQPRRAARSEDAQRAIDVFNCLLVNESCKDMRFVTESFALAITALESYQPWISVKDRLPEKGSYLCCNCEDGTIFVAYYNGIKWSRAFYYEFEVTHWMPLPQAPKEG